MEVSPAWSSKLKMFLASDHITAATGKTLTVTASKNGGSFNALSGTVSEVSSGWYKVALDTTDTNTLGTLIVRATAASCDDSEHPPLEVVAYDATNANSLGLGYLDAAVSTRSTYAGGAVASVTGDVGGNVTGSVGSVTGNVGGNVVGSVASDTGNVGGNVVGSVASVTGSVGGNVTGSVGSVVGAVGSVTGNVGGNVVGSVGSVAAAVTVGTNNDKTGYTVSTVSDKTGYALTSAYDAAQTAASPADVQTSVDAALDAAGTELSAVPSTTGSLREKLTWLFQYFRNRRTVTATTETLYKEDAATSLGTSTISDNGTTFDKGEMN